MIKSPVATAEIRLIVCSKSGDDTDTVVGTIRHPSFFSNVGIEVPSLRSITKMKTGGRMEGDVSWTLEAGRNLNDLGTIEFGDAHGKTQRGAGSIQSTSIDARWEEDVIPSLLSCWTACPNLHGRRAGFPLHNFWTHDGLTLVSDCGLGGKSWAVVHHGAPTELHSIGRPTIDAAR